MKQHITEEQVNELVALISYYGVYELVGMDQGQLPLSSSD